MKFSRSKIFWKDIHAECLKGNINKGEDVFFESEEGSPTWLQWDIRPWYKYKKEVAGLIIPIEDITDSRLIDVEKQADFGNSCQDK